MIDEVTAVINQSNAQSCLLKIKAVSSGVVQACRCCWIKHVMDNVKVHFIALVCSCIITHSFQSILFKQESLGLKQ